MKAEIQKSYTIYSTHELPNYPPCSEKHEHKYEIILTVLAWVKEDTGMVLDMKVMDSIIAKYDKADLNKSFEIPTVENFAMAIANDVVEKLEHYSRVEVSIKEAENTKVTIRR